MTRRLLLVMLTGLNLFLLSCLLLGAYTPPAAYAQALVGPNQYLLFAAEVELKNDAIYLIDTRNRRMFAFRTTFPRVANQPVRFSLMSQRDLARDFIRR
ncbi:MAG: hypothetical protein AMXMBFR13_24720 [Phycisphaerae bacterium]